MVNTQKEIAHIFKIFSEMKRRIERNETKKLTWFEEQKKASNVVPEEGERWMKSYRYNVSTVFYEREEENNQVWESIMQFLWNEWKTSRWKIFSG